MNLRRVRLLSTIFFALNSSLSLANDRSISDVQSIVLRADGKYDVVCKNGSSEVVTIEQLKEDKVCGGGCPQPGPKIEAMFSRPQGDFFVLCKDFSWQIATAQAIKEGKVCGPMNTFGPIHRFNGKESNFYASVGQGGCSLGDATKDALYFCQHFYAEYCHPRGDHVRSTTTDIHANLMHKFGGCSTKGESITSKTCDGGPCKIGPLHEIVSGLTNLICICR